MKSLNLPFSMNHVLKKELSIIIQRAVRESFQKELTIESLWSCYSEPKGEHPKDLAFAPFRLTKELGKKPHEINQAIKEKLLKINDPMISEIELAGPYLNFTLDASKVILALNLSSYSDINTFQQHNKSTTDSLSLGDNHYMVEYSQPNTHKELHVGHMRNLCLGQALVQMMRSLGLKTTAVTYPGDIGTHVAKCLWYLKNHNQEQAPATKKGAWLGRMYSKAHLLLEEQKNDEVTFQKNKDELTAILRELESKSGPYYELWKETREWSLEQMKACYAYNNVEFDHWYFESTVDEDSVHYIKQLFEQGKLVKDQGAIGIDLSDQKLGFCLLLKSDGTGLYATKDVELARRKFQENNITHNIYVVDNRQEYHFKQVFATLEKLGFEQAKQCHHLKYEMVELPSGAMSSRKGNIVALEDLIEQMEQVVRQEHLHKYEDQWSKEEINHTAHVITEAAIKFGMNAIDPNKKIIFDMKEWLRLDGESGPYLLYSVARINSILNKAKIEQNINTASSDSLRPASSINIYEKSLALKILELPEVLKEATNQLKSNLLCHYLIELAKRFNQFYSNSHVLGEEETDIKLMRLHLCLKTKEAITLGLHCLGIRTLDKM